MNAKLQAAISSLSTDEQERLLKHLTPVIEARQELLALYQTQTAESLSEQELLQKRSPLTGKKDAKSKTALQELDNRLTKLRSKLADHTQQRIAAKSKFDVVKTRFEAHY